MRREMWGMIARVDLEVRFEEFSIEQEIIEREYENV
jgi:hypothetical protein